MYNNCHELDFSVFDIIDATLSFRIFSRYPSIELQANRAHYSVAYQYVTSTVNVLSIVPSKQFLIASFK